MVHGSPFAGMSCNFAAVPSTRLLFKLHAGQRHRIPKARYHVENWPEYDRGLVRRGDIRVWLSEDAIVGWRAACRASPGGQGRFSNLAIETTLIHGAALRLPLRQTVGFMCSLMEVMKLDLAVPDHTIARAAAADGRCSAPSLATRKTH